MAPKLTHSVELPKDRDDSDSKQKKQLLAVSDHWVRQRVQSMDAVSTFRKADQPWRPRLISAPPNAAVKYGRKLRRITDEFDDLLDEKPPLYTLSTNICLQMKRMWSRPASQIRQYA